MGDARLHGVDLDNPADALSDVLVLAVPAHALGQRGGLPQPRFCGVYPNESMMLLKNRTTGSK